MAVCWCKKKARAGRRLELLRARRTRLLACARCVPAHPSVAAAACLQQLARRRAAPARPARMPAMSAAMLSCRRRSCSSWPASTGNIFVMKACWLMTVSRRTVHTGARGLPCAHARQGKGVSSSRSAWEQSRGARHAVQAAGATGGDGRHLLLLCAARLSRWHRACKPRKVSSARCSVPWPGLCNSLAAPGGAWPGVAGERAGDGGNGVMPSSCSCIESESYTLLAMVLQPRQAVQRRDQQR